MLKKLWAYTVGYRKWIAAGVACAASEAVFELLLPLVMAGIVDKGIPAGDTTYILTHGLLMVAMAAVSMSLGIGSAVFSSRASPARWTSASFSATEASRVSTSAW